MPARLLKRRLNSHKGDYGHILVLAGSSGYTGSAILCARTVLRAGAGLVTLGVPESLLNIYQRRVVEVMTLGLAETPKKTLSFKAYAQIKKILTRIEVLIVGPGLSQNPSTQKLVRKIIKTVNKPMVIDADGLNALVGHLDILRKTKGERRGTLRLRSGQAKILTPHPGEMARLLGVSVKKIQENRKNIAKKFARDYNTVLVLKGHNTIVAQPKAETYINKTGNPGMATAGSGDVLTGMIGAFLAQGLDGFSAAKYGVYLHGLAGDLAAKDKTQIGLIASDIIERIPGAIKLASR
ncbi:MAG: NAD(P)H-hydrate dehydratase [Candidatus Omnitrophota bacterium]